MYDTLLTNLQFAAIEEVISGTANCPGCGAQLHSKNSQKLGYMDPKLIDRIVEDSKKHFEVKQAMLQHYERQNIQKNKLATEESDEPVFDMKDVKSFERVQKQKHIMCQRCHELLNYGGLVSSVDITAEDFYEKLGRLRERKDALIVLILDMFNVEGSIIPRFEEIVGTENPVLIVGNKADLLPFNAKFPRIESWLHKYIFQLMPRLARKQHEEDDNEIDGVFASNKKSQIRGVILVSSKSGLNIVPLAHRIEKLRASHRDVFIVGCTNVGKSTLINELINRFRTGRTDREIKKAQKEKRKEKNEYELLIEELTYEGTPQSRLTTSILPGTTLRSVSFPISSRSKDPSKKAQRTYLYDTPGVINQDMVLNYLTPKDWKILTPPHKITPQHYRMRPGKSIFLGGLARIDYVDNVVEHESWNFVFFTVFASSRLPVHTTSTQRGDELYEKHVGTKLLSPPVIFDVNDGSQVKPEQKEGLQHPLLGLTKKETFQVSGSTRGRSIMDIVVPGVGWIAVTGVGNITIDVHVPENLSILKRESLMPFETMFLRKDRYYDV
jgi:ribosome biogenesis GTPase A